VLLPFAGGLIGVAIGFLGTLIRVRHERSAQWQRWFQESAAEFVSKLAGDSKAVEKAISRCDQEHPERRDAFSKAAWYVGELPLPLNKVLLLYGKDSPAGKAAREAVDALDESIAHLEHHLGHDGKAADSTPPKDSESINPLKDARQALSKARDEGNTFLEEAYSEIREARRR
jgi:hypothetical protein